MTEAKCSECGSLEESQADATGCAANDREQRENREMTVRIRVEFLLDAEVFEAIESDDGATWRTEHDDGGETGDRTWCLNEIADTLNQMEDEIAHPTAKR